ncbi:omwaprin-b-like [Dreissena polymorpha]|uniref:WAP domain-containing protein n=1 Tax=Dreissena polymorpha TaxID=45954 RepID=A0A9D4GZ61_DREPO|nr:omwaprin-b-like [Dreissena polymorpha]KAH3826344.1 hypothetical protein DPMN_128244 [Dreissena polymorpha]
MHLLLRFGLTCVFIVMCSTDKSGTCPPLEGGIELTVCKWDCTSDYGCPGEQKCCSYGGCVDVCRTPISALSHPIPVKLPQLCTCVCVTSPCPCCPDGSVWNQLE